MPEAAQNLWTWFWELDSGRSGSFTANPLSWSDIFAWSSLTGVSLKTWQLLAIKSMDVERLKQPADDTPNPVSLNSQLRAFADLNKAKS